MFGDDHLARLQDRLQGISGMRAATVVHTVEIAILEDYGLTAAGDPLPGLVEYHRLSSGLGSVKLQLQPLHRIGEVIVDE